MEGDLNEYSAKQRDAFTGWSIGLLVAVIVLTVTRAKFGHLLPVDTTMMMQRSASILQNFLALTMCWNFFKQGDWYWRSRIHDRSMAKVVNAFSLTVVSVGGVIFLDWCADRIVDQAREQVAQDHIIRAATTTEFTEEQVTFTGLHIRKQLRQSISIHPSLYQDLYNVLNILPDKTNTERALRTCIGSAGFLVGICWERSFEASDETIVESTALIGYHPVLAKVVIAAVLVIVVFPAWLKYLVPYAQMTEAEHWWLLQHENKGLQGFRRIECNINVAG